MHVAARYGLLQRSLIRSAHPAQTAVLRSGAPLRWFSDNAGQNQNGSGQQQPGSPEDLKQQAEAAAKRISELEEEVKKLKQEMLYALADQENTRRIAKKDVADAKAFGATQFAKSLLDVADTLEKAVESGKEIKTDDSRMNAMIEGVVNTESYMLKAMKSNGVEPYGVIGEKFDPNKHEALAQVPDPKLPEGSLYKVLRRGWALHSRVLRPAQVVVSKAPPEIDPAFLERKVTDKIDEADEEEIRKNKHEAKTTSSNPSSRA